MKKLKQVTCLIMVLTMISCSQRLTDFTVISTKNTNMIIPPTIQGERVEGKDAAISILGIPLSTPSVKEAIDRAIEEAGPGYDALIDGVVTIKYFTVLLAGQTQYVVEGTPIKSSGIKTAYINGTLDKGQYPGLLFHSKHGIENENINFKVQVE